MNRVYYVVIKGKTLESRNLRELLSRAVSAKRDSDRKFYFQARCQRQGNVGNLPHAFMTGGSEVTI